MLTRNAAPLQDPSASTSLTISVSDSVDLDLVDDIIAGARNATSFAQVHDSYTRVLEVK
jgi:hypothetical protein